MASANEAAAAFCYPHAGPAIRARWIDRSSDTSDAVEWIDGEGELDKTSSASSVVLAIVVELTLDIAALDGVLAAGEKLKESVEMLVLLAGTAARRRESVLLLPDPNDDSGARFTGSWQLERSRLAGNIVFTPSLLRTDRGPDAALAAYPGEELADSLDSLTLKVTESKNEVAGDIDIRWIEFPKDRPADVGNAWVIEAASNSDPPKLFLDSSIKDFHVTLHNQTKGSSALHKRRDLLLATIASEVYTSLANSTLSNLSADVGDDESGLSIGDDDWRRRLLDDVANRLFPDCGIEEAFDNLLQAHADDPVELSAKIARAAQLRSGLRKALAGVVALSDGG